MARQNIGGRWFDSEWAFLLCPLEPTFCTSYLLTGSMLIVSPQKNLLYTHVSLGETRPFSSCRLWGKRQKQEGRDTTEKDVCYLPSLSVPTGSLQRYHLHHNGSKGSCTHGCPQQLSFTGSYSFGKLVSQHQQRSCRFCPGCPAETHLRTEHL